jgi:3-oxoacyl-[acyl-carrier-protein] synthase-3
MNIRIASMAYALPPDTVDVQTVMIEEKARIEAALAPLSPRLRKKTLEGLGMERVRVCAGRQPYDLAREAASQALDQACVAAGDIDLIIDFVTLPGKDGQYLSFAQKLSVDLGAETSLNLSFRVGGCGGFHLAMKNALALMETDESLQTALLVTADSPPEGSRSLLPITIQGDAGSAVVLTKRDAQGPIILGTEVLTLGHLYDTITISRSDSGLDNMVIHVDSVRIENELMPIYYLNFFRLIGKILDRFSLRLADIDFFIYSNLSGTDRNGFIKALGLPEEKVITTGLVEFGHTFASDLVINYTDFCRGRSLSPGQLVMFASAGIGFTWGVTLARA